MQQNTGVQKQQSFHVSNAMDVALATAGAVVFTAEVLAGAAIFSVMKAFNVPLLCAEGESCYREDSVKPEKKEEPAQEMEGHGDYEHSYIELSEEGMLMGETMNALEWNVLPW